MQLVNVARTLLRHFEELLSYFEHRINNGKAEGINNKIKVLKREAYGFRDQEYFKLKLYNLHKEKMLISEVGKCHTEKSSIKELPNSSQKSKIFIHITK